MSTFCSLCFIFLVGFVVSCSVVFGIYFFYEVSFGVLMWVFVSSESSVVVSTGSISIGLNQLDNGIGSFIRIFC